MTFLLAWHFPERCSWTPQGDCKDGLCCTEDGIGNYYTTQFRRRLGRGRAGRAATGRSWKPIPSPSCPPSARAICPRAVKEAALFNLSTLRSQTCFRTPDGALLRLGGLPRHKRLLPRLLHARVELRADDGLPLRRPGEADARGRVRPRHPRRRPDELPREPARRRGRRNSARPPPTGRWAAS